MPSHTRGERASRAGALRWGALLLPAARLAAAWLLAISLWMLYASVPVSPGEGGRVAYVRIPEGTNARGVAQLLYEAGVIRDPLYFLGVTRLLGSDTRLQAGTYAVAPGESPFVLLRRIVAGDVALRRVTIPEGYTARDIARLLARQGIVDEERFLELALGGYPVTVDGRRLASLEGYLFPDTYVFPLGAREETVIDAMLARFRELVLPLAGGGAGGLSLHEIVTLASIVEREAARAEERPLIAGVFLNRLRLGMPLQSDPTVRYALGLWSGRLEYAHLQVDSPYNTYKYPGLPPGPIANPGLDAVLAVLFPEPTEYMYFVAKGDGTHHFSVTYADHLKAVERYRR